MRKTVRHLTAGDVLVGSGFTVTRNPYTSTRSLKGKLLVEGFYPGSPVKIHTFNASTNVTVVS